MNSYSAVSPCDGKKYNDTSHWQWWTSEVPHLLVHGHTLASYLHIPLGNRLARLECHRLLFRIEVIPNSVQVVLVRVHVQSLVLTFQPYSRNNAT